MTETGNLAELYVLGALDGNEHDAVARRIAKPETDGDHALAEAVASFREAFHDVDLNVTAVPPAEGSWDRLEAMIGDTGDEDTTPGNVAPFRPREPAQPVRQATPASGPGRDGRWRQMALGAMAASVLLAAGWIWQAMFAPGPLVMAILLDEDGNSVAVVEAFEDDSLRVTPLVPIAPDGAQVLQVWTKPDPAGPPVSLGILQRAMRAQLDGPELPRPSADQLYEITIEPEGGSPTGGPTGPIVGKGLAQQIF